MLYGEEFREKMNIVFEDLRADFDVSTSYKSKERIEKLKSINFDISNDVETIASKAKVSNGLISGSRGTGKSHLMLLSRDKINNTKKNFCVYINLKEHSIVESSLISMDRYYLWVILRELKKQLDSMFICEKDRKIDKILDYFNLVKRSKRKEFEKKYIQIDKIIKEGENDFLSLVSKYKVTQGREGSLTSGAEIISDKGKFGGKSSMQGLLKKTYETTDDSEIYSLMDINRIKELIIEFNEILELDSIIFFYDEWSSIRSEKQEVISSIIKSLSIYPIFHWIGYIPYMNNLGVLEKTADLPICKDLDLKYIYEENKDVCLNYFKGFADKRIENIFGETEFTIDSLVTKENFDIIVKAAMGNTRDFGIILNYSWENYKNEFLGGKEYERFHLTRHIGNAIKKLGVEKESNLEKSKTKYTNKLWIEIKRYISNSKYTHFCIEDSVENSNFFKEIEFEELMYYRILHLRKLGLSNKDIGGARLKVYAADTSIIYSRIFETKNESKRINLVTCEDIVNDKIRRNIFKISKVMNEYRVEEGKQIICNCGQIITSEMTYAWENKLCVKCGKTLGCA